MNSNNEGLEINIAILGDRKCGKSSLVECFLSQRMEDKNTETVINITKADIKINEEYNLHVNFLYEIFYIL
jgi:GTPase SAR1 family protein